MKFVTFVSAPPDQTWETFQTWFATTYIPAIPQQAPNLRGGVFRRRISPPDPALAPPAQDPVNGIAPADVIMETWLPCVEDFRREIRPREQTLREIGARAISYAVAPRLHKDPRIAEAGPHGRRPEVTYVISLKWKPGVNARYAMRAYEAHAPLALRLQPALTKYEQNFVREVISWTPGTPTIDAYADFSFRTTADVQKFRVTEEETQDTSSFIGGFHAAFFGDAEPFG